MTIKEAINKAVREILEEEERGQLEKEAPEETAEPAEEQKEEAPAEEKKEKPECEITIRYNDDSRKNERLGCDGFLLITFDKDGDPKRMQVRGISKRDLEGALLQLLPRSTFVMEAAIVAEAKVRAAEMNIKAKGPKEFDEFFKGFLDSIHGGDKE